MKLIRPSVTVLHITPDALGLIEAAGRTCYKSEEKMTASSAPAFVERIIKSGHHSVLEHAHATLRFVCDRGVTHEIVRHRLASYCQESTRYCDYDGGDVTFIIPLWTPGIAEGVYQVPSDVFGPSVDSMGMEWVQSVWDAEEAYRALRKGGWRPEQARSVLPNSLKTEIVMTANFREWRHFFDLRAAPAAHPQMREVAFMARDALAAAAPVVFGGDHG